MEKGRQMPFLLSFLLQISLVVLAITEPGLVEGSGGLQQSDGGAAAETSPPPPRLKKKKLFVFGDSFADTGNLPKLISPSWYEPYGMTFPMRPAGRFSDGRVITDYFASFLGTKSPIPYKYRRFAKRLLPFGMNFAVGGSGVFNTTFIQQNLGVQIETLKQQIDLGVYSAADLQSSVALVSVSGNDYVSFTDNGGTMEELRSFSQKLINQMKLDLKRLRELGIPKVAVLNLHPIGCLPSITSHVSHQRCNVSVNTAVQYHNELLDEAITELNNGTSDDLAASAPFVTVDVFRAFMAALMRGDKKSANILEPCCQPVSNDYSCGSRDLHGVKMYRICSNLNSSFYWDSSHPTQAGWHVVFSILKPSLVPSFS